MVSFFVPTQPKFKTLVEFYNLKTKFTLKILPFS